MGKVLAGEGRPGAAIALTGANGAGKSTLLALLLGMRKPGTGKVWVDGGEAGRLGWRRRARLFGYLPQQADLVLQAPTAVEELAFSLRWSGTGKAEAEQQARQWLTRIGLAEAAERPPHLLSRGERQRLTLAAVMIAGPRLLVLDEPFAGQDPAHLEWMTGLLGDYLAGDSARALLVSTHDFAGIGGLFTERWHLQGGRLRAWTVPAADDTAMAAAGGGGS